VYVFVVNAASDHPLVLTTTPPGTVTEVTSGVTGTMNVASGTFTYTPTAATTIYYQCSVHLFGGTIVVSDGGSGSMNSATSAVSSLLVCLALVLSVSFSLLV